MVVPGVRRRRQGLTIKRGVDGQARGFYSQESSRLSPDHTPQLDTSIISLQQVQLTTEDS